MSIPEQTGGLTGSQVLFAKELLDAAQKYRDMPFVNHAATVRCGANLQTHPACMEIGLGPEGYDCSGLVIRALTDVMGVADTDWAWGIRHVRQMSRWGNKVSLLPINSGRDHPLGLLFVYNLLENDVYVPAAHIGIYSGGGTLLHARSRGTNRVAVDTIRDRRGSKRFAYAIDPGSLVNKLALLTGEC